MLFLLTSLYEILLSDSFRFLLLLFYFPTFGALRLLVCKMLWINKLYLLLQFQCQYKKSAYNKNWVKSPEFQILNHAAWMTLNMSYKSSASELQGKAEEAGDQTYVG